MYGVAITDEGKVVINLGGIQTVMHPADAEDLIGLIHHAIEIVQGLGEAVEEETGTLQ